LGGGFLGTRAGFVADITLLMEIAMALGLLVGAWLARRKRFRQHAWCQASIMIINLFVIGLIMLPGFREQVSPRIPARLGRSYYALAAAHATLGGIAECLGLCIVLGAGTKLLPERFRLKRYKRWMRVAVVIWWFALLVGIGTYARWYIPQLFRILNSNPQVKNFRADLIVLSLTSTTIQEHSIFLCR
jgi:uncharacterized membrane protein YozB (DUF420 family)